ncbi:MAG: hypothetical protein WCC60_03730 [Ilumatobacteraceae bacterium]
MTSAQTPRAGSSSRRQFLFTGAAAAAGALLLGGDLVGSPSGLQLLADSSGPRIPVAYLAGSAGSVSLAAALASGSKRAVPAAGLRGEGLAGRAGRLSVSGFASAHTASPESAYDKVLLDALVPSPSHHDQTIPFYALTFRRNPAVSLSSAIRLSIGSSKGLRVGFRVDVTSGTAPAQPTTTVFTSRPQRGLPTLLPGVYLLGLQAGMWSQATTVPAAGDAAWAQLPSIVLVAEAEPVS